ncbi:hypothetical protein IHE45_17G116900 [Dioscorea alata]|uniref:Uncharacterized protein n=1 Tax=Dioscorea alata TaxID=55571 RepID=A0ACB7UEU0_DIOAL|nr:hypothetical protein IHE45_17G116900 [Dioscorea alata]
MILPPFFNLLFNLFHVSACCSSGIKLPFAKRSTRIPENPSLISASRASPM